MGAAIYTLLRSAVIVEFRRCAQWGAERVCEGLGSRRFWFYEKEELGFVKIDSPKLSYGWK
jgi:hypothetical protein